MPHSQRPSRRHRWSAAACVSFGLCNTDGACTFIASGWHVSSPNDAATGMGRCGIAQLDHLCGSRRQRASDLSDRYIEYVSAAARIIMCGRTRLGTARSCRIIERRLCWTSSGAAHVQHGSGRQRQRAGERCSRLRLSLASLVAAFATKARPGRPLCVMRMSKPARCAALYGDKCLHPSAGSA